MEDKFISPHPPPTNYQRECLEILIEECAEVQQRATKMLRFGVEEVQPGQPYSNKQRLGLEVGDVQEIINVCITAGILYPNDIARGTNNKRKQLLKYMQTKPEE